tara:strand:+ start:3347 stop:4021 length:675 start_codon:yes stop_codon:yes gene_type:complete
MCYDLHQANHSTLLAVDNAEFQQRFCVVFFQEDMLGTPQVHHDCHRNYSRKVVVHIQCMVYIPRLCYKTWVAPTHLGPMSKGSLLCFSQIAHKQSLKTTTCQRLANRSTWFVQRQDGGFEKEELKRPCSSKGYPISGPNPMLDTLVDKSIHHIHLIPNFVPSTTKYCHSEDFFLSVRFATEIAQEMCVSRVHCNLHIAEPCKLDKFHQKVPTNLQSHDLHAYLA